MKWLISAFGHEQINRSNWAVLKGLWVLLICGLILAWIGVNDS
jgi:hypothetical protein